MKTKVLMFGWEFPPYNIGGLGTACLGLTRALMQENVDVVFVLPRKIDVTHSAAHFLFADDVNEVGSISFSVINSVLSPYITSEEYVREHGGVEGGVHHRTLLGEVRRYALRARTLAQENDFDIIHAHDWLSFLAGIEAKKVSGKPLVLHMHATEFDRTGNNGVNQEIYDIEKYAMGEADTVIAVSQFTKDIIISKYGINPAKIEVVHNGIEMVPFRELDNYLNTLRAQGNKVVLSIGRITVQKGIEFFLRSAASVLKHKPNVYFVIVGSGDARDHMIMEVARLGISNRVIFSPFIQGENDKLHAVYRSADLYIMPSVSEPFGIGPLESIMNGTPVIISKQSGVSEVLSHALKVDFWDTESLTNKILSVLNHDSLHDTLQENAHKEIKHITWKRAAQKCVSIYKKLFQ